MAANPKEIIGVRPVSKSSIMLDFVYNVYLLYIYLSKSNT